MENSNKQEENKELSKVSLLNKIKFFFTKSKLEREGLLNTYSRKKNQISSKKTPFYFRVLCFIILWIASLLAYFYISNNTFVSAYIEGQILNDDLIASTPFQYENEEDTQELRNKAASEIPPLFSFNSGQYEIDLKNCEDFLSSVRQSSYEQKNIVVKNAINELSLESSMELEKILRPNHTLRAFFQIISSILKNGIGSESDDISSLSEKKFGVIYENDAIAIIPNQDFMTSDVAAEHIVNNILQKIPMTEMLQHELIKIFGHLLINPTLKINIKATTIKRAEAKEAIAPVISYVKNNAVIIEKNLPITAQDVKKLLAYRHAVKSTDEKIHPLSFFSFAFQSFCLIIIYFFMIKKQFKEVEENQKLLLMISLIITVNIGCIVAINYGFSFIVKNFELGWNHPVLLVALFPLTVAGVLVTTLINSKVGEFTLILFAILLGMISQNNFFIMLFTIIIGSIANLLIKDLRNQRQIFKTTIITSLVTIFFLYSSIIIYTIFSQKLQSSTYIALAFLAIIGAIISYFLIVLLLQFFEFLFGCTTNISLLDLCDFNHKLLHRLQMDAPGSYHHSLIVATIAEQAARSIGANPLLTRVCAYFHDIGKIAKSEYFTENNINSSVMYEDLNPKLSSLIIMNHVKEGVNLALKYKLKKPIIDAIEQHHGKSLVSYFYNLAKNAVNKEKDKQLIEDFEFRYPGPLPKSKEVVILSIADPCEAASRSLQKPTPSSIEALVEKIILERFEDNQFIEAEITLEELNKIKISIIKTLSSILHTRIAYNAPINQTKEEK